jgi:Family of unknown function (DUF6279)
MITMSKFIALFRRYLLIIAAVLLPGLAGCSAIKLAYNQAPDLTYWWLDGYFDFNGQQSPKVRDELAKLFAWHRANELPKTAALLSDAARLMPGEITAAQACRFYEQGRSLVDSVAAQALPTMAEMVPTFSSAQLEHLQRKFVKNNEEYTRDYLRSDDAKRLKRSIERSESIYGKLGPEQIAVIQKVLANSGFDAQLSLKERKRRQQDTLDTLSNLIEVKATPQAAQQALRALTERAWNSPDPAFRAYAQKLTEQSCQNFALIHASTTATQRAKAVQTLRGYEQDLRTLIASK